MIVEMRTYRLKPGLRGQFLEALRTQSAPEPPRLGTRVSGPFVPDDDPDVCFFMRGFPDPASHEAPVGNFYGEDPWKQELESILLPMVDRYDVVVVGDPDGRICWGP
jgi:hypothetical protein